MTAVCAGGGTSSARTGFGATVALTVPAIAGLLNNIPTPWAVGAAAYLGLIAYDLNTFCTTDPPTVPTITAADGVALLTFLDPMAHFAAVAKFEQLIGAYAWYQMCQCDSGAQPTPPTPPAAPTGFPSINPPAVGPSAPTGQACSTAAFNDTLVVDSTVHFKTAQPLPLGATYVTMDGFFTNLVLPTTVRFQGRLDFYNSGGSLIDTQLVGNPSGSNVHHIEEAIPSGAASWNYATYQQSGTAIHLQTTVNFYCGTTPSGGGGPICTGCPPDALTAGMLDHILQLVTLIQRQAVPFAYIAGTSHTGLTGDGQLTVQGLIGAKITITANAPGTIGVQAGDPEYLWDAGWINWGSADGFTPRQFLSATTTLSLPPNAGAYTLLGYSLAPGVVVTIQELTREP